ncbi:MAG: HD domain-containing protein [Lachnospiraceae bacterium]|nr:HD domain-containing protein [Lachnospiraceae bacterium]
MERLEKQMDFLLRLDRMKQVVRQTYLADGSRKENDAEHSWHMAVMTAVLAEYANEPIDVGHTILLTLVHDIIEVEAGDTYAYDAAGNATKREREVRAAEHLYGLLPEDQGAYYRALWDEFEAMETPEAKFANAMDKMQPVILTDAADGKSWKEHGVHIAQVMGRNARTHEGSEELWAYEESLLRKNREKGNLLP